MGRVMSSGHWRLHNVPTYAAFIGHSNRIPIVDAAIELVRITPATASPQPGQRTATPPRISVRTGDDGGFALRNIASGDYRLYATSDNGFVPVEYGQKTSTGLGIPLTI